MARCRPGRTKSWLATKRYHGGREETIGWYKTKDEAECVEYDYGRPIWRKDKTPK